MNGIRFSLDLSWFQGIDPAKDNMYSLDEGSLTSVDVPADWLQAVQRARPSRLARKEKKA